MKELEYLWNLFLSKDIRFQIVLLFSILLFLMSVVLVIIVLRIRARKSMVEKRAAKLLEVIEPIILDLVYTDEYDDDWTRMIRELRNELNMRMYEFHSYSRVSDYLVNLHQQLAGESGDKIERIYRELKLPQKTLKLLKEGPWYHKVKALSALAEFGVKQYLFEVIQYVDHSQRLVRDEAQYAAMVLGGKRALQSIASIDSELSKWQQLRLVEEFVDLEADVKEDVFSWFASKNDSLIEMALRIALRMGWYEVIMTIPVLLEHNKEQIRLLSVQAVAELGTPDMLVEIIRRFDVESRRIQVAAIEAIAELDVDGEWLDFLKGQVWYGHTLLAVHSAKALNELGHEDLLNEIKPHLTKDRKQIIDQVFYGAA